MGEQMTMSDFSAEKIILREQAEEAEQIVTEKVKARNKAQFLINDAKCRYVKEKTRARSKKAAEEKDMILNSPRFDKLKDYERREDIQDAYGYDIISETERDKLEELWDEREQIKNKTEDGIYTDLVTKALNEAWIFLADIWEDEIEKCQMLLKDYKKQRQEAETAAKEWMDQVNRDYEKFVKGGTT